MSTGAIAGIGIGVVVVGGVIFFVLHQQDKAALAARANAAAIAARPPAGGASDLGAALADLGGRALADAVSYYTAGATDYAGSKDDGLRSLV